VGFRHDAIDDEQFGRDFVTADFADRTALIN
jgi:hypothetical protein